MQHAWEKCEIHIKFSVRMHHGKRPQGRSMARREDNTKMDLRVTGCKGGDWIKLAQDRVEWRSFVGTIMNLQTP
jgi:hypothetical protein